MGDQASSAPTQIPTQQTSSMSATMAQIVIRSPLKFLMNNLKHIVHTQLTAENYAI